MNYRIFPPDGIPEATINMPLSKSISNRMLILNALSPQPCVNPQLAECADTMAMQQALEGTPEQVNIGAAGTAMRFLTSFFAISAGREVTLDGDERMRQRPIGPLVDALRLCGAHIQYVGTEGFPPLRISGRRLTGGEINIDATISSQYISSLLMVAPLMQNGLVLHLQGEPASLPYIDLTLHMMRLCGVEAEREYLTITVPHATYGPVPNMAEGDWSAASYWYEIQALSSGFTTLGGLSLSSLQPDRDAARIFANLGVESAPGEEHGCVDLVASPELTPRLVIDLSHTPDLTPAIAVTCALLGVPFNITGLQTLHIKETDRIAALSAELLKLGVVTESPTPASLVWDGSRRPIYQLPEFDTYADHRMAMALAPVSIFIPGIVIRNAEVVEKSYPDFWSHLLEAGFQLLDPSLPMPQPEEI